MLSVTGSHKSAECGGRRCKSNIARAIMKLSEYVGVKKFRNVTI